MGTIRVTKTESDPDTRFHLIADLVKTEGPGTGLFKHGQWTIRFYTKAINLDSRSAGFGGDGFQEIRGNSVAVYRHSGHPFLPSGAATGSTRWEDGPFDVIVPANKDGYWNEDRTTYPVSQYLKYSDVDDLNDGLVSLPRIPQKPDVPVGLYFVNVTASGLQLQWDVSDGNGSPLTGYDIQYSFSTSFSNPTTLTSIGSGKNVTGLKGAGGYYFRVRSKNKVGVSAWSETAGKHTLVAPLASPSISSVTPTSVKLSWSYGANVPPSDSAWIDHFDVRWSTSPTMSSPHQSTAAAPSTSKAITGLPANSPLYFQVRAVTPVDTSAWSPISTVHTPTAAGPILGVSPSSTGTSVTLTLSPPPGYVGADYYQYQYRITGATAWSELQTASSMQVVTGLTPQVTYDWRAVAVIGDYVSPYSAIITVKQPQPNVAPGFYFDGSTPASSAVSYSWVGTAGSSASVANGKAVTGWESTFPAGFTGVVYSALGGFANTYSARVMMLTTTPTPGMMHSGTSTAATALMAAVSLGLDVEGSIYVRPSRSTLMAAMLLYFDASGVAIRSTVASVATPTPAGVWTRLVLDDTAPGNAAFVAVHWTDVAGSGWQAFAPGDFVDEDAAQVTLTLNTTYFNGSMPDDGTYLYNWQGATNASPSIRTVAAAAEVVDPLIDPDCPPLPSPPSPPQIDDSCIDTTPESWLRYWTTIPADRMPEWQSVIPIVSLTSGDTAVRQIRIRYYQNPFDRDWSLLDNSDFCAEQIVSYIPPSYKFTLDGVTQSAYAEPVGTAAGAPSGAAPASQLLYGTGGGPATWPELTCGIQYEMAVDVLALTPDQGFNVSLETAVRW